MSAVRRDSAGNRDGVLEGPRLEGYGRLAGALFLSASVLTIPGAMLLQPPPPAVNYFSALVGVATGLACFAVPWARFGYRGFDVLGVIAVAETAVAAQLFGYLSLYFYFLIAVFAASVQPGWRRIAPHLALISVATLLPAAFEPSESTEHLRFALFGIPIVTMAALMTSYLRHELDEQVRNYERLSGTTEELVRRIRHITSRAARPEVS